MEKTMKNAPMPDSGQTDKPDEKTIEQYREMAEIAIALREEENVSEIDVEKELSMFKRNLRRKRNRRIMLRAAAVGAAAAVLVLYILMPYPHRQKNLPQEEGIFVFHSDTSVQQITLQIDETGEKIPVEKNATEMPFPAKVSPHEINYTVDNGNAPTTRKKANTHKLYIPRGEMFKVVLSDGTEVLLNADSRLSYPSVFKGKQRIVALEGEAYFNVAKDAERPFIVKSGALYTKVLGTIFNICNYNSDKTTITLIEGKVEISDKSGTQRLEIAAGEKASITPEGIFVEKADTNSYVYWKEGYFYFDDCTMVDMMKEIGRWYNVDIEFRNRQAMELRMHFFADRREDIFYTIQLLNSMEKVHASFVSGKVIIE